MMHRMAICKPGIGKAAKASRDNAKSGVYNAPYEPCRCNMPMLGYGLGS